MKCSQVLSIINGLLLSTNVVAFTFSPVMDPSLTKHSRGQVLTSEQAGLTKLVIPRSNRINSIKS